jgi:HTH-type transcriptional regulator/antitoxin HigA
MKQIQPIRNQRDCDTATREIARLMDKEASQKLTRTEAARLEVLATLVDAYESALVQDVPPDPIEALKFRLEQLGLPPADLARTLGSRPRASEILSRKRRMTLPMIRKIHQEYGVPPEVLIQDYPLKRTGSG